MKKIYGIGFLAAAVILTGAYYMSYQFAYQKSQNLKEQQLAKEESTAPESLTVQKGDENIITKNTKYIQENYDLGTKEVSEETMTLPAAFLGMTRTQLMTYLSEYMENPSEEDLKQGLESYELISFSSDEIVLRKSFESEKGGMKYCLLAEDNYITVYNADRTEVYTYTGIVMQELPEELQQEIVEGKYIADQQELYNFLENYSS